MESRNAEEARNVRRAWCFGAAGARGPHAVLLERLARRSSYQRRFLFSDQFGLASIAAWPRVFNQKIAAVVSGGTFDTYCPMASSQMALM